ncbi:NADPH:quinone oxidoreductase family protein [Alicyclobacillus tolerans]|uniref:NADPH:quinone oxidoreductase family protein n=1 Tax=Alicyclobacillus tolerans TaxID=90970 RepID=UPI001F4733B2|nr:NADPH:quinone oxidoreductase family protein [Alicyclobacillus tolerans]MCF8565411.1 NADPH:quinone oxidoreductase family protein [Alicyclobacillus tolerans]
MRALVVEKLADPDEALRWVDLPDPKFEPGKVKIRVQNAAVNFFDILLCQGKYQEKPPLPFTPGGEVAGIVTEVGPGSSLHVGQKVMATPLLPNGGFAQWVVVPEEAVYPIPEQMSFQEAAAMFITYQTSYYALHHRAHIQPGEVLLVHAGAGGVGSSAIQLGRAAGAKVIATAGGPEKVEICRDLGADIAIDYRREDFVDVVKRETNGKGADVIYDPVGGDVFDKSRKCIAFDGRLLVIGFAGGRIADAPTNHALVKNYSIVGVHWGLFRRKVPGGSRQIHAKLMELYRDGHIRPLIYQEFQLEDVPRALHLLGSRNTWGKLVVAIP